jgi:hypothetical protein
MVLLDTGRHPPRGDRDLAGIYHVLRHLREQRADMPLPAWLAPYRCALDVYAGPDEPDRAVLEAGMLARRPPEIAGQPIGLSAEAAQAYAAAYYDVADRLCHVGFVAHILGGAFRHREPRLGYVLRAYACRGGSIVLDDLLHAFGLGGLALTPPYQGEDAELHNLGWRVAVAMHLLPPKQATARFLFDVDLRYRRLDQFRHDPHRYEFGRKKLLQAQLRGARRLFGAAARDNPFLRQLFSLSPGTAD